MGVILPQTVSVFLESLKTPRACGGNLPPDSHGVFVISKKTREGQELDTKTAQIN